MSQSINKTIWICLRCLQWAGRDTPTEQDWKHKRKNNEVVPCVYISQLRSQWTIPSCYCWCPPQIGAHSLSQVIYFFIAKCQEMMQGGWGTVCGAIFLETRSERDMCTPMFITALFVIARAWKQPRCPSADKWIRKLWYIYTMEYYSAIKKNSFESVLMRWMKVEPIIQSEVSQKDDLQIILDTI